MRKLSSPWVKKNKLLLIIMTILIIINVILGSNQAVYILSKYRENLLLQSLTAASRLSDPTVIKTAASLAQTVTIIDITNCNPNPKIFRLNPSQEQIFRNADQKSHILTFSADKIVSVTPGDTTIKLNFLRPEGVSPYFCDGIKRPVGAIYLTE